MLSELGKYGARMLMGTQSLAFLDQVNERARATWLDNTSTLFVFRSGADDAQVLSRELSITDDNPLTITPNDIVGLPDYTCYVRLRNKRGQPRVFRLQTDRAPEPETAAFNTVRAESIQRHCRDADTVDSWIKDAQQWQGKSDFGQSNSHGHHSAEAGGRQPESIHGDPPLEKSGSPEDAARERARVVTTGSESGRSARRVKRVAPVDDLSTHANDTTNTAG